MHARRLHVTLAVLIALGALAACTSQKEALIARGFDPAYAEGYDDGCSSGNAAAGSTFDSASKEDNRYASGSQYAQGWDAGFAKCQSDMAEMVRQARLRNPSRDN